MRCLQNDIAQSALIPTSHFKAPLQKRDLLGFDSIRRKFGAILFPGRKCFREIVTSFAPLGTERKRLTNEVLGEHENKLESNFYRAALSSLTEPVSSRSRACSTPVSSRTRSMVLPVNLRRSTSCDVSSPVNNYCMCESSSAWNCIMLAIAFLALAPLLCLGRRRRTVRTYAANNHFICDFHWGLNCISLTVLSPLPTSLWYLGRRLRMCIRPREVVV